MSDPETPTQPLIGVPSQQTAVNVGAPELGTRSSRAYKVAGLTLLACVLIVGQATIAYFLLSQRSDIKSLEEQNNKLSMELTKGKSVSVPVRMHIPMNALPVLADDSVSEKASTGAPGKGAPPATNCQMEALGMKQGPVPGFRPGCDKDGSYLPQQCFMQECWCVNPDDGKQIPGSVTLGKANCSAHVFTDGLLTLPDVKV